MISILLFICEICKNLYSFSVIFFIIALALTVICEKYINVQTSIRGKMGADAQPIPPVTVLSELLTSGKHALNTGRTPKDLAVIFSRFYSVKEIQHARECLVEHGASIGPKKSARKEKEDDYDTKNRHLTEILAVIVNNDWYGKPIQYAAIDLSRVCRVPVTIDDEIQLKAEVTSLRMKCDDLETLCKRAISSVTDIANKVDESTMEMKNTAESVLKQFSVSEHTNNSLSTVQNKTWNRGKTKALFCLPLNADSNDAPAIIASTPLSPSDKRNPVTFPELQDRRPFILVTHRKPKTQSRTRPPVVGSSQSSAIRAIKVVSSIFLSRCQPDTTTDDVKSYIESEKGWEVKSICKLKTRFETYSSFRIDICKPKDDSELLNPASWPADLIVRRFYKAKQSSAKSDPQEGETSIKDDA